MPLFSLTQTKNRASLIFYNRCFHFYIRDFLLLDRFTSFRHSLDLKCYLSFRSATRKSICRSFLGTRKPKEVQPPASKQLPHPPSPSAALQEKHSRDSEVVSGPILSLTAPLARPEDISNDSGEGSGETKEKGQIQSKDEDLYVLSHSCVQVAGASSGAARLNSPVAGILDKARE